MRMGRGARVKQTSPSLGDVKPLVRCQRHEARVDLPRDTREGMRVSRDSDGKINWRDEGGE